MIDLAAASPTATDLPFYARLCQAVRVSFEEFGRRSGPEGAGNWRRALVVQEGNGRKAVPLGARVPFADITPVHLHRLGVLGRLVRSKWSLQHCGDLFSHSLLSCPCPGVWVSDRLHEAAHSEIERARSAAIHASVSLNRLPPVSSCQGLSLRFTLIFPLVSPPALRWREGMDTGDNSRIPTSVSVRCEALEGIFYPLDNAVEVDGTLLGPTEFEKRAGRGMSRNWRKSIFVLENGSATMQARLAACAVELHALLCSWHLLPHMCCDHVC